MQGRVGKLTFRHIVDLDYRPKGCFRRTFGARWTLVRFRLASQLL